MKKYLKNEDFFEFVLKQGLHLQGQKERQYQYEFKSHKKKATIFLKSFFQLKLHDVLRGHPAYNRVQQSPTLLLLRGDFIKLNKRQKMC